MKIIKILSLLMILSGCEKQPKLEINTNQFIYYQYLNDNEQQVYEQIMNKIMNYEKTLVPNKMINIESLNNIMNAIFNDHPEYFYLDTSYAYKYADNLIVQITLNYNELMNDIELNKEIFDNKVNEIINNVDRLDSDLEKETYIHQYLINNVIYDENSILNQSAYSALIYGESVCAGYARAFQLLMNRLGIITYYCSGTSYGNHAWNIIQIEDEFYNVDVTWNDSNHTALFFNKNDDYFSKTHLRSNSCKQLPKCE